MLATAWLLQTDIAVYWQYQTGGGWVRYRCGEDSKGRAGAFLLQCIQGGRGHYGAFHCEPLWDFPEPMLVKIRRRKRYNHEILRYKLDVLTG